MERKNQDLLLGGVFFAALATLLAATFYLSDVEALFVARPTVQVDFNEVGGLSPGNSVFVKGYRVGEVGSLQYVPGTRKVRAVLVLQQDVDLFEGYDIRIEDGTLLGGKQIDIDPGSSDAAVPRGAVLAGTYTGGPFEALGGLDVDSINQIIADVREFASSMTNEDSTVYKLFNESVLYDQLQKLLEEANKAVEQVNQGPGPVHTILYGEEANRQLTKTLENLESATNAINDPEAGPVGALINDKEMLAQLEQIVDDIAKTTEQIQSDDGLVGRLLREKKLADDVATIADELAQTSKKLNDPEAGLLGAAISDPRIAEQFRNIVDNIDQAASSLTGTDSLLGRLINDEDTAEQFSRILNQVSRAIEDAREAAPVSTFFTVVTGAF